MTQPKLPTGWWLWRMSASEMRAVMMARALRGGRGSPGRGRLLRRGALVGRRQVQLLDVLLEHARGRELPHRGCHRGLHHLEPTRRYAIRVALVIARHDLRLEQPVEVLRVGPILGAFVGRCLARTDGPAIRAVIALVPPAVEDRAVDYAVHGRLHTARAACLERTARVVQPDID